MERSFDLGALLRNHKKQFKTKPTEFVNVAGGVQKRLERTLKDRKNSRSSYFDKLRNVPKCESPVKLSEHEQKLEKRKQQLEKWKQEKKKRKMEEALRKKKPFITGVVHVPLKFELPPPVKPKPSTQGRVTRSQTAKITLQKNDTGAKSNNYSFAPINASFRPPKMLVKTMKNSPITKRGKKGNTATFQPTLLNNKLKESSNIKKQSSKIKQQQKETKDTGNKPVKSISTKKTTIAVVHEERLSDKQLQNSSKSDMDQVIPKSNTVTISEAMHDDGPQTDIKPEIELTPGNPGSQDKNKYKISPCVTVSRGKENARREMKKKIQEGLLDEDTSDIDNVDHFRRQLASEIKRITEMCETWEKINEQTQLPDIAQEAILSAVGQARLLMSQKLAQFGSLVERCARPERSAPASPAALVTPADLHGFWDMVYKQIEDVDVRFMKLSKLKEHGWVDEQPDKVSRKVVKPVMKKSTKPATGPSKIREMIAAARKAKKDQLVEGEKKTFEAGFFCVRSPVRSPSTAATTGITSITSTITSSTSTITSSTTPNHKATMLKSVLSSEANKASASKKSASFAMLRASLLGKNMEYDGIAPLPQTPLAPINLEATPVRSILKSGKGFERSINMPIKVVFFDKSDTDMQNVSIEHENTELNEKHKEDDKVINGETDENINIGVSLMNLDDGKENSIKTSRVTRQNAFDEGSPMLTRRMRQNLKLGTPDVSASAIVPRSTRRSARKTLHELEDNDAGGVLPEVSKRSSRRRKSELRH